MMMMMMMTLTKITLVNENHTHHDHHTYNHHDARGITNKYGNHGTVLIFPSLTSIAVAWSYCEGGVVFKNSSLKNAKTWRRFRGCWLGGSL